MEYTRAEIYKSISPSPGPPDLVVFSFFLPFFLSEAVAFRRNWMPVNYPVEDIYLKEKIVKGLASMASLREYNCHVCWLELTWAQVV